WYLKERTQLIEMQAAHTVNQGDFRLVFARLACPNQTDPENPVLPEFFSPVRDTRRRCLEVGNVGRDRLEVGADDAGNGEHGTKIVKRRDVVADRENARHTR